MQKQVVSAVLGIVHLSVPLYWTATAQAQLGSSINPITERVVSIATPSGQGSGVIIKHDGDTYTILTAAHVVGARQNSPLKIVTFDRQQYITSSSQVQLAPNALDLATVTFQSAQNYPVAQLGDSTTLTKGQTIFAAGFLNTAVQFYPGKVVASSHRSQPYGYGLILGNADILPGMSGGGVFTDKGILVGINGKSVGNVNAHQPDRHTRFKPVSGLAIPIDTFAKIASQMQVDLDLRASKSVVASSTADDYFVAAQHKSEQGNYQEAIDDYARTLALNPNFNEVYFRRGIAHSSLAHWPEAMADYTRSIAINPDYTEAYVHRGNIRNILSDWRGAKSDFNMAIALNPYISAAYIGRGTALCELNDCQLALTDYNRAIELNPASAYAFTSRGIAYHRLGNKQTAISNYLAAAEIYRKEGKDRDYLDTVQRIKALVKR
jgi:Flp pilus assembly protein TadD